MARAKARPLKSFSIGVGKRNIRASTNTAEAALGRQTKADMQDIVDGFKDFIAHMENYSPDVLLEALEPTLELSWEYCPVDSGDLIASSYLEVVDFRGGGRVEMGYARGGKPSYAVYVHEMPYSHEPPTSSKFLQRALDEDYYQILQRLVKGYKTVSGV